MSSTMPAGDHAMAAPRARLTRRSVPHRDDRGLADADPQDDARHRCGRSGPPPTPSSLRAWVIASRPHTLTIGVSPVLVGCALAWAETGRIDFR